ESAIVFQAIAISATTDDAITFTTKLILQFTARLCGILKENNSALVGGTNPIELGSPVVRLRHQAGKRGPAQGFANIDSDLVAFGEQTQIQRAEIAGIAYAKKPHGESENTPAAYAAALGRAVMPNSRR